MFHKLSTFRCGEFRAKWIVHSTRLWEPKTPLSLRANLILTPYEGREIRTASSRGLIYFVHLAVERDELSWEWNRDTMHRSLTLHDFFPVTQNRRKWESSNQAFYLPWKLSKLLETFVLFCCTRKTSIQEHITGNDIIPSRETQPIIQRSVFIVYTQELRPRFGEFRSETVVSPSRFRINRKIFIVLLVGARLPLYWIQMLSHTLVRTMKFRHLSSIRNFFPSIEANNLD